MKPTLYSILVLGCLVALAAIYSAFFSKSSQVYSKIDQVKVGMTQQEVVRILSPPDLLYTSDSLFLGPFRFIPNPNFIYKWESGNDSILIMHYDMGFAAPDALRVVVKRDSVMSVAYNQ
ncbi:hypothetical protein F0P96_11300 [Hymenobacter busanensis]|uniref:Uncharacterized protein n=1 Tax=Hymenobacter busanensis TaxID=2607656 RepID=A0A7L4ZXF9_9BACT|nr:hypothetical protein [Hymenobacter busanensis]KAA9332069.1 hypothetical protein F0P96_11300 [Hymenobacter busanensis]QHJ07593.1 hypothetical protein GUY19_09975 [Hymenobacter busanensis]